MMRVLLTLFFITLFLFSFSVSPFNQGNVANECDCEDLQMKGKTENSAFKEDKPFTGTCYAKDTDGVVLAERPYYKGLLSGELKSYHTNGKLKELLVYSFNQMNGKYLSYNEEGTLIVEGSYRNGLKEGTWTYYFAHNGQRAKSEEFRIGKKINGR